MSDNPRDLTVAEDKIAARFDAGVGGAIAVSKETGGIAFKDAAQVMEFAKLMAISQQAVPKHLRGQPGMCLAVAIQALNWRMEPFAVANKTYAVNDRLAYEAQLIAAVIHQRAPIKGRIRYEYRGEGQSRSCTASATLRETGDVVSYTSPPVGQITVKNSPLWKSDPDQQLAYYSARSLARRHFPDVILGVYEQEELAHAEPMRDVTPVSRFEQRLREAQEPRDVHHIDAEPAAVEAPVKMPDISNDDLDAALLREEGELPL